MAQLKRWRYAAFIGGFLGILGMAIYPIIIQPMINPEPYREFRKVVQPQIRDDKRV